MRNTKNWTQLGFMSDTSDNIDSILNKSFENLKLQHFDDHIT